MWKCLKERCLDDARARGSPFWFHTARQIYNLPPPPSLPRFYGVKSKRNFEFFFLVYPKPECFSSSQVVTKSFWCRVFSPRRIKHRILSFDILNFPRVLFCWKLSLKSIKTCLEFDDILQIFFLFFWFYLHTGSVWWSGRAFVVIQIDSPWMY